MPTKEVRFTVTKREHEALKEAKGDRTWQEAVFEEFGVEVGAHGEA